MAKKRFFSSMVLIIMLFATLTMAFSFRDLFIQEKVSSEMLNENEVIELINNNPESINFIKDSGINSLTIKTEQRSIHLQQKAGKIVQTDTKGDYTIRTSELKLINLKAKYDLGEPITIKDVKNNFQIPLSLYWKVMRNIWF